jgi:hypothetical protein
VSAVVTKTQKAPAARRSTVVSYDAILPPSADQLQHRISRALWEGRPLDADRLILKYVTVVRATPHQREVNGAGYEIEIQDVLPKAYALPNLGAPDGTQAHSVENKWLARLRRFADKNGAPVVRKWQNRLIFHASVGRGTLENLAMVLSGWVVEDFRKRFVTAVERATVSLAEDEAPLFGRVRPAWQAVVDGTTLLFGTEEEALGWTSAVLEAMPWHLVRTHWLRAVPK